MAAKVGYKVCTRINGQQSIVGALIKDTGVLKGQGLGDVQVWPFQWSQPGTKRKATTIAIPSRDNSVINSMIGFPNNI